MAKRGILDTKVDHDTVRARLDTGYYKCKAEYPTSERVCPVCREDRNTGANFTMANFCVNCGYNYKDSNKDALKKYWDEYNTKAKEFHDDALEAVGLSNHPKAERIFEYAYEHGHSAGYGDIYSILQNISDLFLDDIK